MSETVRAYQAPLIEAGLLPGPLSDGAESVLPASPAANLLPWLIRVWNVGAETARGGTKLRARRTLAWFDAQLDQGACLTWGLPMPDAAAGRSWLGPCLAWWPRGVPPQRRVGPVSSRLGRSPETRRRWFTVLRAACATLDPENDLLLSAGGTTTAPYVERCAVLFGVGLLRVIAAEGRRGSCRWWWQQIRRLSSPASPLPSPACVYLSPILAGKHPDASPVLPRELHALPLRDRALVALSDRLVVLHMRRKGNLERLVRARLVDPAWPVASVRIALGSGLTDGPLADAMLHAGAVGWMVLDNQERDATRAVKVKPAAPGGHRSRPRDAVGHVKSLPRAKAWDYLTHCTRRPCGPWPDQPVTDYLDALILDRDPVDRSPLSTITRIVSQRRLIASARTIRGGYRVVSFTSIPLGELYQLRVFRPFRCRWDFEPYGICIRRQWLQQLDTRPVGYAGDAQWAELSEADRPFFQLDRTRLSRRRARIDWTVEQEWRHVGDLPLHGLPSDAGLVFVPSEGEAESLRAICPWPVVVVPCPK